LLRSAIDEIHTMSERDELFLKKKKKKKKKSRI